jgi:hypothetical protein
MKFRILLVMGILGILAISGCTQQAQSKYACSDGSVVTNPSLCPHKITCIDGSIVNNQDECPKEKQLQTDFKLEAWVGVEAVSINENGITITINQIQNIRDTVSVFVSIFNNGKNALGGIHTGVVCSEPKYDLMPLSFMVCPPFAEGCFLDNYNNTMTLSPLKSGGTEFYWKVEKIKQLVNSDSITCNLTISSSETHEIYYKEVTVNFVK